MTSITQDTNYRLSLINYADMLSIVIALINHNINRQCKLSLEASFYKITFF